MGAVISSVQGTLILGVALAVLYAAYRAALPRPLAGIPYNREAAHKLLGDVPEMLAYVMRTKRVFCWLSSLTARHQSPIIQAFIKPMGLPWVVVTDPFESQDILLRRTKEFDRSGFFGELIGGILPEQHIQFLSTDDRFKHNRNLINHLMAPSFITQVLGPELYKATLTMIRLWELKCTLAEGRPFAAHHDITYMALDMIFAALFAHRESEGITAGRLQSVSHWKPTLPESIDAPVPFPEAEIPAVFAAALTLANHVTGTQLSPFPRLNSWVLRQFPYMKRATALKDAYIRAKVTESLALTSEKPSSPATTTNHQSPHTALHSVLLREQSLALKESRPPRYYSRAIADEFFGFMLAGHDTSATTLAWGVKFLSDHPSVQNRLRQELRAAMPDAAAAAKRTPSYSELAKLHVPYLDAVVEEVLRHANTIAFVVRRAQEDATVLGRRIPRGTDVFLMANGAGYLERNMPVDDSVRSPGARNSGREKGEGKGLTGMWEDGDIGAFKPERWLKRDGEGMEVFDSMAGPSLAFGLGPRGCYGKRFALHGLRIQFAMLVWHFHLLKVPDDLNGYDSVQRFAREPTQCYVRLSGRGRGWDKRWIRGVGDGFDCLVEELEGDSGCCGRKQVSVDDCQRA